MDLESLQTFFFYCMIINFAIYFLTSLAILILRKFIYRVHLWMFKMDEETMLISMQKYLSTYKLLITVFNFTPWLALLIIN